MKVDSEASVSAPFRGSCVVMTVESSIEVDELISVVGEEKILDAIWQQKAKDYFGLLEPEEVGL